MPFVKIFPSLLSADFGNLQHEINRFEPHVDGFHFDVMDGHFVPNLSMGAPVLTDLRTNTMFDVHLMVTNPEERIPEFAKAGAKMISFHVEATGERTAGVIDQIHQLNMKAGVAVKPKTPLSTIESVLNDIDFVLIMSVEPGYSGQSFMPEVLEKVQQLRKEFPEMDIEIDGGINDRTIQQAVEAGANLIVSASYLFGAEDAEEAVMKLKMQNRKYKASYS